MSGVVRRHGLPLQRQERPEATNETHGSLSKAAHTFAHLPRDEDIFERCSGDVTTQHECVAEKQKKTFVIAV
jgi:hypothetical protein